MTQDIHRPQFSIEQFSGSEDQWAHIAPEVEEIQEAAFRDIFHGDKLEDMRWYLQTQFSYERTQVFLMKLRERIVGFTSYYPSSNWSALMHDEMNTYGIGEQEFKQMQAQTVTVGWTGIHPEFQGQGGWSLMMKKLDVRARNDGYKYEVRYVRTANEYANKVEKRYDKSILFKGSLEPGDFGPQTYFRIRIPRS